MIQRELGVDRVDPNYYEYHLITYAGEKVTSISLPVEREVKNYLTDARTVEVMLNFLHDASKWQ